jgi:hypothetical protein
MNRVLVRIPTILRSYTAAARVSFVPAAAGGASQTSENVPAGAADLSQMA